MTRSIRRSSGGSGGTLGPLTSVLLLVATSGALCRCGATQPRSSAPDAVVSPDKADSVDDAAVPDGLAGPPIKAFPLPDSLEFRGAPSSIRVVDLDRDGYLDLILLVARHDAEVDPGTLAVVVAWGDETTPFVERSLRNLPGTMPLDPMGRGDTRDSSSEALVVGDLDPGGDAEIVTAQGWYSHQGDRSFAWHPFAESDTQHLQPVALIDFGRDGASSVMVIRGATSGKVERCGLDGGCAALPGQDDSCPPMTDCAIEDLAAADFDHDGQLDVVAGGPPFVSPFTETSYFWRSSENWQTRVAVEQLHPVDYEVGDVDGDGYPDLVAQQREFISDFPSHTDVWLSDPAAAAGFVRGQTIYNADNHTDNAALADANMDQCLDLLTIGVDIAAVHVALGHPEQGRCSGNLGPHPSAPVDAGGWVDVPAVFSIGIQQLDVNGDQTPDWVLREAVEPRIHFMAIPRQW